MFKLLIADDDINTINGIKKLINMTNLEISPIIEAHNGAEGVSLIRKHKPDILISDIQMPFMNGFEMIDAISDMQYAPIIIMLTGFDDFSYAKRAIDANVLAYIVKPVDPNEVAISLKKAVETCKQRRNMLLKEDNIEKNIKAIKQHIIKNLFLSAKYSDNDITYFEHEYSIYLKNMVYCCICICSNDKPDGLIDAIKEKYNVYQADTFARQTNLLITFNKDSSDKVFKDNFKKICTPFTNNMFITVGTCIRSIDEIPGSFIKASSMVKYSFCYDFAGAVLFYEDFIYELKRFNSNPPSLNKHDIVNAILSQNIYRLNESFEKIRSYFDELSIFDPGYLKSLCFEFCNLITQSEQYSKIDTNTNNLWSEIENLKCRKDVFCYCEKKLLTFKNAISGNDLSFEKDIVDNMKKYIEENYSRSITLTSLSREMYYSRNYLAIIFKKYTGMDFRTYLQEYRMSKAAQMLKASNYKYNLMEIAENVGYHDLKTFRQTFVKYFGMLPSEYEKKKGGIY